MIATDPAAPSGLEARLAAVTDRIGAACERAGREAAEVTLIGITKTHPTATVEQAVAAGLTELGENRVEEFVDKARATAGVNWHFVGQLQSRKANRIVGLAGSDGAPLDVLIHSVDRTSLIDRLERLAGRDEVVQRILVQVNVGDDPRKGGCGVHEVEALVAYAAERPSIAVQGLMTIPPMTPDGADPVTAARPHFARLRELRDHYQQRWPQLQHLSMGMSADLEAAVEEGATMVRIGTALFGPRPTSSQSPGGHP